MENKGGTRDGNEEGGHGLEPVWWWDGCGKVSNSRLESVPYKQLEVGIPCWRIRNVMLHVDCWRPDRRYEKVRTSRPGSGEIRQPIDLFLLLVCPSKVSSQHSGGNKVGVVFSILSCCVPFEFIRTLASRIPCPLPHPHRWSFRHDLEQLLGGFVTRSGPVRSSRTFTAALAGDQVESGIFRPTHAGRIRIATPSIEHYHRDP